jgi:hypothetical protein
MPKGMQAIYSNSFSSGAGQLNFNNIPQTYTDLKIVVSQRNTGSGNYEPLAFRFDSSAAVYSNTAIGTDGSTPTSQRVGASAYMSYNGYLNVASNGATANTFGLYELYIPNYTSSAFKQVIIDAVTENNNSAAHCDLGAGLYASNSPITFVQIGGYATSPNTATSITIYGISR